MGLLADTSLTSLIQSGHLIQKPPSNLTVRGAAVELCVGDIYLPGSSGDSPGSPTKPLSEVILQQGQTAVIRTLEVLSLDLDHAAVAFPAAIVSLKGLLMTNPGFIDPGYVGQLHVTAINMGKAAYSIKRGERLMRCLFFRLDSTAAVGYTPRGNPITEELLAKLSSDFINVEERAEKVAKREITDAEFKIKWAQIGVPIIAALLAVVGTVLTESRTTDKSIAKLEASLPSAQGIEIRLSKLESLLPLEDRVDALERTKITDLDERLKHLETIRK